MKKTSFIRSLSLLLCLLVVLPLTPVALAVQPEEIPGEEPVPAASEEPEAGLPSEGTAPVEPEALSEALSEEPEEAALPTPPEDSRPIEADLPMAGGTAVSGVNFPDPVFLAWVAENADTDHSTSLSAAEIAMVKTIDVNGLGIADMTGIRIFTSLEKLKCDNNNLTKLDVSVNPALTQLECRENALTELKTGRNAGLVFLACSGNQLSALDVRSLPALQYLLCSDNRLTELDVSGNSELINLQCSLNQLSSLDVSDLTELKYLLCSSNRLKKLDVSHNPDLESLLCHYNQLTELDVSHNPKLTELWCDNNQLTELDVRCCPLLRRAYFDHNHLRTLDLRSNPALLYDLCAFGRQTIQATLRSGPGEYTLDFAALVGAGNTGLVTIKYPESGYTYKNGVFTAAQPLTSLTYIYDHGFAAGDPLDVTVTLTVETAPPVISSIANTASGIKLAWSAVPGTAKYAIYRKSETESKYTRISVKTTTSYVDQSAVNGTYYYYRIWALDAAGKTVGDWSNARGITCVKNVTPTISSIANTPGGVQLTWGAVPGVAKYAVYRKAEGESKYSRYTVTAATSYTDKNAVNGTFYYYRVWSLDASGKTLGEWSNAKGITCVRDVTPKISSIANTASGVKLTWGAVPGVVKYAIYRKAEGESKYKRISIRTTTSYVDQSALDGTFYYYRIWSMDSSGNTLGEWSTARGITCSRAK